MGTPHPDDFPIARSCRAARTNGGWRVLLYRYHTPTLHSSKTPVENARAVRYKSCIDNVLRG